MTEPTTRQTDLWLDSLPPRRQRLLVWALLGIVLLTVLVVIGQYGFFGPDEPRYARIAQEMLERGDAVLPTLKGVPWMEKPPLLYWLIMGSYLIFGFGEFAARFPSAVLAVVTMGALYAALRPVYGFRPALLAAAILGSGGLYLGFAGAAATDMPLTCCLTLGLLGFWQFLQRRAGANLYLWGACLFFGLAALAKGLLALIIPFLAIYPALAFTGGLRRLLHPRLLPGLLIFALVAAPWFILMYQREGFHFILVFFINHHLARFFTTIHHHSQPFYFYLPVLILGLLPWTPVVVRLPNLRHALQQARQSPQAAGIVYFAGWFLIPFLFFSVSVAKLPGYILPLLPAAATLLALGLDRQLRRAGRLPRGSVRVASGLFLLVAAAAPVFAWYRYHLTWQGILLGLLLLPAPLLFLWLHRRRRPDQALLALTLYLLFPLLTAAPALFPVVAPYHSHRLICREAMTLVSSGQPLLIYRHFHHTNDYYTDYTCTPSIPSLTALIGYLENYPRQAYVLTRQQHMAELAELPDWTAQPLTTRGRSVLVRLNRRPGGTS
ncbi:MAG: glycosyltransferase family 39 protein [Acidobacteria bacterium]|nr:glycosyltransferase family 39 protein [Acidobacteriota bacterium]